MRYGSLRLCLLVRVSEITRMTYIRGSRKEAQLRKEGIYTRDQPDKEREPIGISADAINQNGGTAVMEAVEEDRKHIFPGREKTADKSSNGE